MSDRNTHKIGEILSHYQILKKLGEGGMGAVLGVCSLAVPADPVILGEDSNPEIDINVKRSLPVIPARQAGLG
jgi:hypothetical protein